MKRIFTPTKQKKILIVDYDPVVANIYQEKLRSGRFKVDVVRDGESALIEIKKEPIDLVILDLWLPGIGGLEVIEAVRKLPLAEPVPVIVFSNTYVPGLKQAFSKAGGIRCIRKCECSPRQILEIVQEVLLDSATPDKALAEKFETEHEGKLSAGVFASGSQRLAKLRVGHNAFVKAQEKGRLIELIEMHRQARLLADVAGVGGFRKTAQLATALEALLFQLYSKPTNITSSTIRTIAHAVDLLGLLLEHAANAEQVEPTTPAILVVDDEAVSRQLICSALEKANLVSVTADDPVAAERLLEQTHFDLIFLDVEMPEQNGLDLCTNIRKKDINSATPVVFVTAHSDFVCRAQSSLSGGNDFIAKPFLPIELAVKALTWLLKGNAQPLSIAGDGAVTVDDQRILHTPSEEHFYENKRNEQAISSTCN